jgi:hypothetical protein
VENPPFRDFGSVRVFAERDFTTRSPVTITGNIRGPAAPDTLPRRGRRRLRPRPAAPGGHHRGTPEHHPQEADASFVVSEQDRRRYLGNLPASSNAAGVFALQPYDRVLVRPLPDLAFQRAVAIHGEVRHAGSYTLQRKDERLVSVIERAGGLNETAFVAGARFYLTARWST